MSSPSPSAPLTSLLPPSPPPTFPSSISIPADDIPLEYRYQSDLPVFHSTDTLTQCWGSAAFTAELLRDTTEGEGFEVCQRQMEECRQGSTHIILGSGLGIHQVALQLCLPALKDVNEKLRAVARILSRPENANLTRESPLVRAKMELIDGCLMEVERLRAVLPYWDELAREEEEEAQREIDRASGEEEEKEEEIISVGGSCRRGEKAERVSIEYRQPRSSLRKQRGKRIDEVVEVIRFTPSLNSQAAAVQCLSLCCVDVAATRMYYCVASLSLPNHQFSMPSPSVQVK